MFAARSDKHALVVVCGRLALPSLIRYDLRLVLADLRRGDAPAMPRLPRKPSAPRPRGAVGAMAASLARRKAAREPRVVLTDPGGHPRTLEPEDPAAERVAGRRRAPADRRPGRSERLIWRRF